MVNIGPTVVSVIINSKFHNYRTGVFSDPNCLDYNEYDYVGNHWALVVGYGTDLNKGDYWIIKLSRGVWWGEKGEITIFFKIFSKSKN